MGNVIKGIFILSTICYAENYQIQWIETIHNGWGDVAYDVDVDNSNNIIVTGVSVINSTQDVFTVKYDPTGMILWTDTFDYDISSEDARSVVIDRNDCVIITGHTWFNGCKYLTIKLDPSGAMLWNDTLNTGNYELAQGVAVDSSNNIIITGISYMFPGTPACVTVKYNPNGTMLWADTVNYGEVHSGNSVAVDNQNNLIVASDCNFTPQQYSDIVIVKYDSMGTLVRVDTLDHNGERDYAYDITVDNSNNVIVAGILAPENGSPNNFYIVKYNSNGVILWEDTLNTGAADGAYSVAVDSVNNIVVAGYAYTNGSYGDYLIVKYDSLGTILWQDILDIGGNWDYAYGVAFDKAGDIIVTGETTINSQTDYCTVKYEYVGGIAEETNIITTGSINPITCIIAGPLILPKDNHCRVFDILGKEVTPSKIGPGIYFIKIGSYITHKVVKLK